MFGECAFRSFFLGGFESSTHYRRDGIRLDLIGATGHDSHVKADYERLRGIGIETARDGVRWHLIERRSGEYDFSSLRPMVEAARDTGMQVIWDLCHYGWPDGLDIFAPEFVWRFSEFARATARLIREETDEIPYFAPVNEISFFAWAGAEVGILPPFVKGRGGDLKSQLVRATIAAIDAIRDIAPEARFVQIDPLIHIVTEPDASASTKAQADAHCRAQFHAWDMLCGRREPELGGHPRYLDIVGGNYYVHNQWVQEGSFIERTDSRYRPFHEMLVELRHRYGRPIFIGETGIEDGRRPDWLRFICDEVALALAAGVRVEGICLYPIVNHPGWDDDRHCHNGLWDYCNDSGRREIYIPLADELRRQQIRLSNCLSGSSSEEAQRVFA